MSLRCCAVPTPRELPAHRLGSSVPIWNYESVSSTPAVTLYWRPGCPYCWRLRTRLKRAGVAVDEINIWEDPEGAAFVRSVTGGDETVPTVRIGEQSLVNPSPRQLLTLIRAGSV